MEKKFKVWIVLNEDSVTRGDGGFGDYENLRFGFWGAELRKAELMVADWKNLYKITKYKVVPATISFKIPHKTN